MPVSTVCAVLARLGLEPALETRTARTTEPLLPRHAGELVHVDVKKLGRFHRPGHRVLGRGPGRTYTAAPAGKPSTSCVDDATRLAYVEVLPDERAVTTVGFFDRALAWFARTGVTVRQVMTDNGTPYSVRAGRRGVHANGSSTSAPGPTGRAPTARPNGSSRPCCASGPTPRPTAPHSIEPEHCPPGSTTTTTNDPTAPSDTRHPPAGSTPTDQRPWDLQLVETWRITTPVRLSWKREERRLLGHAEAAAAASRMVSTLTGRSTAASASPFSTCAATPRRRCDRRGSRRHCREHAGVEAGRVDVAAARPGARPRRLELAAGEQRQAVAVDETEPAAARASRPRGRRRPPARSGPRRAR